MYLVLIMFLGFSVLTVWLFSFFLVNFQVLQRHVFYIFLILEVETR